MAASSRIRPRGRGSFEPQCTHITMTRLHDPNLLCGTCYQPGPQGWVYVCTQDREDLIEHAAYRHGAETFDDLGDVLQKHCGRRRCSAESRQDKFSFLDELTPAQLSSYRPSQIATILRQRENVIDTIAGEERRSSASASSDEPKDSTYGTSPHWLCRREDLCYYSICSRCRPGSADRSFLSLDAVANGELLPTAVVGYGFHVMRQRPVISADLLRAIGCRPTALPRLNGGLPECSFGSGHTLLKILKKQILKRCRGANGEEDDTSDHTADDSEVIPGPEPSFGTLKRSPRYRNLVIFAESPGDVSPSQDLWDESKEETANGDSSMNGLEEDAQPYRTPIQYVAPEYESSFSSEESEPFLDAREVDDSTAPDTISENINYYEARAGDREHGNASFHDLDDSIVRDFAPSPLKVNRGVAMLEESIELGVPDVITQV